MTRSIVSGISDLEIHTCGKRKRREVSEVEQDESLRVIASPCPAWVALLGVGT